MQGLKVSRSISCSSCIGKVSIWNFKNSKRLKYLSPITSSRKFPFGIFFRSGRWTCWDFDQLKPLKWAKYLVYERQVWEVPSTVFLLTRVFTVIRCDEFLLVCNCMIAMSIAYCNLKKLPSLYWLLQRFLQNIHSNKAVKQSDKFYGSLDLLKNLICTIRLLLLSLLLLLLVVGSTLLVVQKQSN